MEKRKLDNDFFEIVLTYNLLTDQPYLGSLVDIIKPAYFKNKNIAQIVDIIVEFFQLRGEAPTITEIKTPGSLVFICNVLAHLVCKYCQVKLLMLI